MKTRNLIIIAAVFGLLGFIVPGCSSQEKEIQTQTYSQTHTQTHTQTQIEDTSSDPREVWDFASVSATVEAIDHQSRKIALRGPSGDRMAFTVGEQVKRLNEIDVGDEIVVDYYVSLATELREPTPEEQASPLTVVAGAAKMPAELPPGVAGVSQIKAVATVVGIDRPAKTVMLKGPRGNYAAVRVLFPERLEGLKLGDTVVATYTEALAVSLEKN